MIQRHALLTFAVVTESARFANTFPHFFVMFALFDFIVAPPCFLFIKTLKDVKAMNPFNVKNDRYFYSIHFNIFLQNSTCYGMSGMTFGYER